MHCVGDSQVDTKIVHVGLAPAALYAGASPTGMAAGADTGKYTIVWVVDSGACQHILDEEEVGEMSEVVDTDEDDTEDVKTMLRQMRKEAKASSRSIRKKIDNTNIAVNVIRGRLDVLEKKVTTLQICVVL